MRSNTELSTFFYADRTRHRELASIIGEHFNSAVQASETEVCYPGEEAQYALKIAYGKVGIVSIRSGPTLSDDTAAAIRAQVRMTPIILEY